MLLGERRFQRNDRFGVRLGGLVARQRHHPLDVIAELTDDLGEFLVQVIFAVGQAEPRLRDVDDVAIGSFASM